MSNYLDILLPAHEEWRERNLERDHFTAYSGKGDGTTTFVNADGTARREVFYYEKKGGVAMPPGIAVLDDKCPIPYENSANNVDKPVILARKPGGKQYYMVGVSVDAEGMTSPAGKTPLDLKTAGSGSVSSVAMTVPTDILAVSGSPVTTTGTLAVTKANQTANYVFAGPTSGGAAAPTFRALVAADIPAGVGTVDTSLCTGRLTLTTATPVTTADVSAAGTLYFTPYGGGLVSLYSGTAWATYALTERSLSLTLTSGKNYDVFLYNNSGTLTLELSAAWTNDTTRADALALQDGVLVKSGATTRRYVGTIRASGSNVTEDSVTKRFVYNHYNRVPRKLAKQDTTDNWTYTTNSFRSLNNSTANRVEFVQGVDEMPVRLVHSTAASHSTGANAGVGIGLDSTTVNSADVFPNGTLSSTFLIPLTAYFEALPGIGYHYLQMLEIAGSSGTTTFYGDAGLSFMQQGCVGQQWG